MRKHQSTSRLFGNWFGSTLNRVQRPARSSGFRPLLEALEDRLAPSVTTTFVNDNWHFVSDNGDNVLSYGDEIRNDFDTINPGGITAFYGVNGFGTVTSGAITSSLPNFDSINDAIANTNVGGTVNVLAGTYEEQVTVNKSLRLAGAQAGVNAGTRSAVPESIIDGSANLGTTPFSVTANDVTIDGFTVQGATSATNLGYGIVLGAGTSGSEVRNNIIQNNVVGLALANNSAANQTVIEKNLFRNNNQPGSTSGTGIYTDQFVAGNTLTNVLIDNNTFTNNAGPGVNLASSLLGSQSNVTISNNTFTNNGNGVVLFNTTNLSITGNSITGATGSGIFLGSDNTGTQINQNTITGGAASAINVGDTGGAANSGLIANNNVLTGNLRGISVSSGALTGVLDARFNNISGNTSANLRNNSTAIVDASGSWWGSSVQATVAAGITGTGPVDFTPFLNSGADGTGVGFQGDFSILNVTTLGSQTTAAGRVQEALDLPANSIVIVQAGVYAENANVNAGDTLAGAGTITGNVTVNANGAINPGQSGTTAILGTGNLTLNANGNFVVDLAGTIAGTGFDQVDVTGTVNLSGNLVVNAGFQAPLGSSFIIVRNDGSDAVQGGFAGLNEGDIVTTSDGQAFRISYIGGDGNDVMLTTVPSALSPVRLVAVSADAGAASHVKVYNSDGSLRFSFSPFGAFNGGVTVATGDINGDNVEDIIVGAAINGHVKVFDGSTGAEISSFLAYGGFTGGVFVAAADVNNDTRADIVTGATANGHVKVFDGFTGQVIRSFLAYGSSYAGAVAVAGGDIDGDGFADIVTGAAANGHVKVFDGETNLELRSFLAYGAGYTGGVFVAAGLLDRDRFADIITGTSGIPPHVKVFSGSTNAELLSFYAYDAAFAGGVRVASGDLDNDGEDEIITGTGPGSSQVRAFDPLSLAVVSDFFAFEGFTGGVFVG